MSACVAPCHGVVLPKSIPIFGNVPNGTSHISSTIGVQLDNSSDLSLGRRPDSKSDEFSSCTPIVDGILIFLRLKPLKSCYTVWEHDPWLRNRDTHETGFKHPIPDSSPVSSTQAMLWRSFARHPWMCLEHVSEAA